MNLRTRKRLSLFLLLVWMPLYIVLAISAVAWFQARFGRLPFLLELAAYVVLGILWVLPFRRVFLGVGRGEE